MANNLSGFQSHRQGGWGLAVAARETKPWLTRWNEGTKWQKITCLNLTKICTRLQKNTGGTNELLFRVTANKLNVNTRYTISQIIKAYYCKMAKYHISISNGRLNHNIIQPRQPWIPLKLIGIQNLTKKAYYLYCISLSTFPVYGINLNRSAESGKYTILTVCYVHNGISKKYAKGQVICLLTYKNWCGLLFSSRALFWTI